MSDTPSQYVFTLVIPFYNEEENVTEVLREASELYPRAEIIAVDDGSSDATWLKISELQNIRAIRLMENRGQSAALYAGLRRASHDVCVLMDGDGQNDPADIAKLLETRERTGAEVAVGRRAKRRDKWSRRVASRTANRIRRMILNDGVKDTGCSLKAFHREHVELLVPFNGLHRYLPAIFLHAGLRIEEVDVNHRPRLKGVSKYSNWDRALRGIYDLFGVRWLLSRKVVYPRIEEAEHE